MIYFLSGIVVGLLLYFTVSKFVKSIIDWVFRD